MFHDTKAFSGFAVKDLDQARTFYHDTLGLDVRDDPMGMLGLHLGSGAEIMVYPKPDHQPATYTILNFPVEDVEKAVDELAARGVSFERYDQPGLKTDDRGVFRGPGFRACWVRDPDGNTLAITETSG